MPIHSRLRPEFDIDRRVGGFNNTRGYAPRVTIRSAIPDLPRFAFFVG